jgi:NTP pyrophosphatase (non-canonical NTP hydrolase)
VSEAVTSSLTRKEFSSLKALQRRLERFDAERGWDAVSPAHTALHLFEELGEVMREMLHLEGYKPPDHAARERLGGELADVTLLLFKLASQYGVDLEGVVLAKLSANDLRFPLEDSRAAMQTYLEQQGLEK